MFTVNETVKHLGHNIQDFTLSVASIRHNRCSNRNHFAVEVLMNFFPYAPLTVQLDGKFLHLAGKKSIDCLPILVLFGEDTQLLSEAGHLCAAI